MRAVRFDQFGATPQVTERPAPECPDDGVVIRVKATGLCRSDWHAWQGHDDSVTLPHTPGHEFAGVVSEVGPEVTSVHLGDRVTVPFIVACGACEQCAAGATQVCPNQVQPGFTLQGSFAEYVAIPHADLNVVHLPDGIDFVQAAGLGCRFGTAYHALLSRAAVASGDRVAIFGGGGVGLSAAIIALAEGARVFVIDPSASARAAAESLGAETIAWSDDAVDVVVERTEGGADIAIDAFGSAATCAAAIKSLRPRGRHVQVGLLLGDDADPRIPMGKVIAEDLDVFGSHGIAVDEYEGMLADIVSGRLQLDATVGRVISLDELPEALAEMSSASASAGMTVATLD